MAPLRAATAIALLWSASPAAAEPLDPWRGLVAEASARFGVPERWILRVMQAESAGRTRIAGRPIRSRAGAIGLMQLMPRTWHAMRDRYGLGPDPDDPHDNILAGAAYLRMMYDAFGYPGLFAGYNAGPARYADHVLRGAPLPAETIAYVARVATDDPVAPHRAPASALFAIMSPTSTRARLAPLRLFAALRTQAIPTEPETLSRGALFVFVR